MGKILFNSSGRPYLDNSKPLLLGFGIGDIIDGNYIFNIESSGESYNVFVVSGHSYYGMWGYEGASFPQNWFLDETDGITNTTNYYNAHSSQETAMWSSYDLPVNGGTHWYIPCLIQTQLITKNLYPVNSSLEIFSRWTWFSNTYWTDNNWYEWEMENVKLGGGSYFQTLIDGGNVHKSNQTLDSVAVYASGFRLRPLQYDGDYNFNSAFRQSENHYVIVKKYLLNSEGYDSNGIKWI